MRRSRRCSAPASWSIPVTGRPGGLVRPHRAHVAGRRGGGRERRLLFPLRPSGKLVKRFVDRRVDARQRSARGWSDRPQRSSRQVPGLRARLRPALPRDRPRHRLSARTCRRCRCEAVRAHRRDHGGAGPARESELDPRERLVRRLRQARDDAQLFAEASASDLEPRTATRSCSPATRRTTRRCSRFFDNSVGVANVRRFTAWLRPAEVRDRRRLRAPASPNWRGTFCGPR